MKTAFGYLFLSIAATMIGVVLMVLFFLFAGKIHTLDAQDNVRLHMIGVCIYGFIHVASIFPLIYFGLKWIKREYPEPLPH